MHRTDFDSETALHKQLNRITKLALPVAGQLGRSIAEFGLGMSREVQLR